MTHELLVEIFVTHRCSPEKIALLRERSMASVEIDLSRLDSRRPPAEIEQAIIQHAPREWLYSRKLEHARNAAQARIAEAERQQRRKVVARLRDRALASWRRARRTRGLVDDQGCLGSLDRVEQAGLLDAIGIHVQDNGCFRVPSYQWQSLIVDHFGLSRCSISDGSPIGFSTDEVLHLLDARGILKRGREDWLPSEVADAVREIEPHFVSTSEAVGAYLKTLELREILEWDIYGWIFRAHLVRSAKTRLYRRPRNS